jgi:hypothetical protein
MFGIKNEINKNNKKPKNWFLIYMLFFIFMFFQGLTIGVKQAYAICCPVACAGGCSCNDAWHDRHEDAMEDEHEILDDYLITEFQFHQRWVLDTWWREYIFPTLVLMTEQLSAVGMHQMHILGTLIDGKQQLEVQRLFWEKQAEAARDYSLDLGVCAIGTNSRTLAATERLGQFNAIVLTERSIDRQLGNINANASEGPSEDKEGRAAQFISTFCNIRDNANGLGLLCGPMSALRERNVNKDVDYARVVDLAKTIDVDFSDNTDTEDERAIFAMSNLLFAHDVPERININLLQNPKNHDEYLDLRSVVAKRSVAENSFNTIVGLKSRGGLSGNTHTYDFLGAIIQELVDPNPILNQEIEAMIGERPSYYAQMEMLSKKLYQSPEFYTNLYTTPANVKRQAVAMQAIRLMMGQDMYESDLRSEALMSLLLEMELEPLQEDVFSRTDYISEKGKD